MKLIELMNASKLLEMPMTSYGLHGDFENPKIFSAFPNKKDKQLLQSEKHYTRTENAFKNTKQNVGCYFVANDLFDPGQTTLAKLGKEVMAYGDYGYQDMLVAIKSHMANSITFIFTGNRDESGMVGDTKGTPMTGWTLAHKIAHTLDEQKSDITIMTATYGLKNIIRTTLQIHTNGRYLSGDISYDKSIWNNLVVAASGRNKQIMDETEFFAELIATWIWYGTAQVGVITGFANLDGGSPNMVGELIKHSIQNRINAEMEYIFEKMVGKIFVIPK